MTYITVGQLKAYLESLDQDMPVVKCDDGRYFGLELTEFGPSVQPAEDWWYAVEEDGIPEGTPTLVI